jgi:hypothetical protein
MKDLDKQVWHDGVAEQAANWTKPNSHMITMEEVGTIDLSVKDLGDIIENFGSGQLSTRYMFGSVENRKLTYMHRSMLFRFPDIITVEFKELSPTTSTFSIFSRSMLGHSDFGANRRRALQWERGLRVAIKRG